MNFHDLNKVERVIVETTTDAYLHSEYYLGKKYDPEVLKLKLKQCMDVFEYEVDSTLRHHLFMITAKRVHIFIQHNVA